MATGTESLHVLPKERQNGGGPKLVRHAKPSLWRRCGNFATIVRLQPRIVRESTADDEADMIATDRYQGETVRFNVVPRVDDNSKTTSASLSATSA